MSPLPSATPALDMAEQHTHSGRTTDMAKTKKQRQSGHPQRGKRPKTPQESNQAQSTGVTVEVDGETYTLSSETFDDIELLDDLNEINKGNPLPTLSVLRRILGKEQAATAIEKLRGENGRVGSEATGAFILKLVREANPNS